MLELITDRTQENVNLLKTLSAKGWNNLTATEQVQWVELASKGAYNYSDLNRVESAVAEIAELLGIAVETKTDWMQWDTPTASDMERYLGNVALIKNACLSRADTPTLPGRMDTLTYEMANNIEKNLIAAYQMAIQIPRLGEIYVGEV